MSMSPPTCLSVARKPRPRERIATVNPSTLLSPLHFFSFVTPGQVISAALSLPPLARASSFLIQGLSTLGQPMASLLAPRPPGSPRTLTTTTQLEINRNRHTFNTPWAPGLLRAGRIQPFLPPFLDAGRRLNGDATLSQHCRSTTTKNHNPSPPRRRSTHRQSGPLLQRSPTPPLKQERRHKNQLQRRAGWDSAL